MAIVFPVSPTLNDTFVVGSITYKWDGDKWIGLGVTPADRLVEGSNSLEINANNDLVWTGDSVGIGGSPDTKLQVIGSTNSTGSSGGTLGIRQKGDTSSDGITITSSHPNSGRIWKDVDGNLRIYNTGTSDNQLVLDNQGDVGIRTIPTTNAGLDINQGYYSIMYGAENGANGGRADNTNKEGRIVQYHRDNEEEPLGAIVTFSLSTASNVFIGGGSSLVNAATETALFAAGNNVTTGGTKILSATIDGLELGTGTPTPPATGGPDNAFFIGKKCKQASVTTTATLDGSGNGTFDVGRIHHVDDESFELFMSICRNDTTNLKTHYCKAYCQKVRGTGLANFIVADQAGADGSFSISSIGAGTAQGISGHGLQVAVTGGDAGVIYRITVLITGVSKNNMI